MGKEDSHFVIYYVSRLFIIFPIQLLLISQTIRP